MASWVERLQGLDRLWNEGMSNRAYADRLQGAEGKSQAARQELTPSQQEEVRREGH